MFNRIRGLLTSIFTDFQTTFIWIFSIGFLICAIATANADENSAPRFKKGAIWCGVGVVVFLLARPIVQYIQSNL
ncbi:hypothetical protein MKY91_20360 [Alkalicoccobacillus gibsonii]|uniref:Uncharacterized protein n=1 Tax=Alkalicoccobacillus gibsonii TaxID=79881 RepID=A0ABU9VRM1_9BACI